MKRIIPMLLCFTMALLICVPGFAEGDGNIDSGSGGMHDGSSQNYWNNEDGVRISVLHKGSQVAIFDWCNKIETSVQKSFLRRNKLDYLHGTNLAPATSQYISTIPGKKMPTIVGGSGGNNISTIKRYFTDELVVHYIAAQSGIPYENLIGGEYKLLLEPIAYFTFKGIKYAMTATEAAKYDILSNRQLYAWMKSLTHQNLPLSMFLEKTDRELGLFKWTGARAGKQSNADIITFLGMGVVSFKEQEEPPEPSDYDYEFHTDTDVIVSFHLKNNTGDDITPDDDAYVKLHIGDQNYNRQFVCPEGETQLVWVQYHTPDTPQVMNMTVTCDEIRSLNTTLTANITELTENEPPDPTFYDTNEGFELKKTPNYGNHTKATWGEWYAFWHPHIVTKSDGNGGTYTVDEGWWDYKYTSYYAKLSVDYKLSPDDRCQTDYEIRNGETTMRSGYAVEVKVEPTIKRGHGVEDYDVTPVQNAVATFPEFDYKTYNRLLEDTGHKTWHFKESIYSYYGNRIHYTPLWYPDDTQYTVPIYMMDAWTPGGQLTATVSNSILIYGSCLDDWYIHITD